MILHESATLTGMPAAMARTYLIYKYIENISHSNSALSLKELFFKTGKMTKLPEKDLLAGTKTPKTTTGEMKIALGKLHDYLADLFGDDSMDKEKARQTLGIDLSVLSNKPDIEAALSEKADKAELENKASQDAINALETEITKRGIPVGSIDYFATSIPPAGYLKADGSAVGRATYPELFMAIGTTFGEGNGDSTFNLPDLIGRFAQGSTIPGQKIFPGLPDHKHIEGFAGVNPNSSYGVATTAPQGNINTQGGTSVSNHPYTSLASLSNPIYGASDTVQPPALTLLPCIKAFDATVTPGLIDLTALAQEMTHKTDASAAAHVAMPGSHFINLSLDINTPYTCPADGYFCVKTVTTSAEPVELVIYGPLLETRDHVELSGWGTAAWLPVKKGDVVKYVMVQRNGVKAWNLRGCQFIYAEGAI